MKNSLLKPIVLTFHIWLSRFEFAEDLRFSGAGQVCFRVATDQVNVRTFYKGLSIRGGLLCC